MIKDELETITSNMMRSGLFHDEDQARAIFIASLFTLRDRLSTEDAIHLGSFLPKSLREKYLDTMDKNNRQGLSVNKSEFLAEVAFHLDNDKEDWSLDDLVPEALARVLGILDDKEARRVKHAIPVSMKNIFDSRISME